MSQELYKTPIKIAGGEEKYVCPLSLVLNPYLGCVHECVYCYAKYILEVHGHWNKRIPCDVSAVEKQMVNALEKKSKTAVSRLIQQYIPFRTSNLTDPFQSIELKYGVMKKIMGIMIEHEYPIVFNTKGTVCARDEYITYLKEFPNVIQYTMITDDAELMRKLEPGAPPYMERMKAIRKLADNGLTVQARYSPVMPLIAENPSNLFRELADAGVKDIICEFGRLPLVKKQLDAINKALGMNYIEYLQSNDYPIEKARHWWKVRSDYKYKKLSEFKKIASDCGMGFTVCCEERPEFNDFINCCNTDKYGFNSMGWAVQMSAKNLDGLDFSEFIALHPNCPYPSEFSEFFSKGSLCNCLTEHDFDGDTYHKKESD